MQPLGRAFIGNYMFQLSGTPAADGTPRNSFLTNCRQSDTCLASVVACLQVWCATPIHGAAVAWHWLASRRCLRTRLLLQVTASCSSFLVRACVPVCLCPVCC